MYIVRIHPRAIKDLKSIPKSERERIKNALIKLENSLTPTGSQKLKRTLNQWRLRVGNYRVLYEIEKEEIVIYRIRHRKEAYRQLN